MEKDIHERENNFFIIEIALVVCLIITVLCFVTDGFGIENIQRNRFDSNILFLFVPVGVALINLAIVSYALFIFNKKNHKEDFEPQRIMSKCVKCGKEFPAVIYGFSKSTYGVGVPESMKDHQNGDLEFYEKNKCDDCLLEEQAKEEEAFENMIEECLKHGCQENCGDKYKEENEKLKYQNARMSRFRNISFVDASDLFQAEKANNDELTLEIQKWNPAQELLISYIKECELTVFEAEKVHDFIRNEIKAKRYKGENT